MRPEQVAEVARTLRERHAARPHRIERLTSWLTPATAYAVAKLGRASIERRPYTRGLYETYGVRGIDYVEVARGDRLPITVLKIAGSVVMVDDPAHWWSIQDTAAELRGRVLVGGLGLGLILHALARNPDIERVTVVERDADVIALMTPNLPRALDIEVVLDDFLEYVESRPSFDSAFVDLWVTHGYEDTIRTLVEKVVPLAVRVLTCTGARMHTLGFVGSEALP
jgi:hypothetical protein